VVFTLTTTVAAGPDFVEWLVVRWLIEACSNSMMMGALVLIAYCVAPRAKLISAASATAVGLTFLGGMIVLHLMTGGHQELWGDMIASAIGQVAGLGVLAPLVRQYISKGVHLELRDTPHPLEESV